MNVTWNQISSLSEFYFIYHLTVWDTNLASMFEPQVSDYITLGLSRVDLNQTLLLDDASLSHWL